MRSFLRSTMQNWTKESEPSPRRMQIPAASRRALIEMELRDNMHRSNYEIARLCDCDPKVVGGIRGRIMQERRASKAREQQ
jgi:hypothetical protein